MLKPSDIIKATGSEPSKPISLRNPLGTGHSLHMGRKFMCAGKMGPNPDLAIDPTAEPEILIQHLLMTLIGVPEDGRESGVVPTERSDEATWELDPSQEAMDPTNPVCMICGQPPVS